MLENFRFMKDFPAAGAWATGFPAKEAGGFVYILCWLEEGREVPFYVGEAHRLSERIDDYCAKQFQAATDFRVGEAVCYLRDVKGFRVVVRYKTSAEEKAERLKDEYQTARWFQTSGARLLNDFAGYDYRNADPSEEREALHKFCEVLIYAARSPFIREARQAVRL